MLKTYMPCLLGIGVSACSNFGVAARIDPPKVATYEAEKCEVESGYTYRYKGTATGGRNANRKAQKPINLDCFTLPDQIGVNRTTLTETKRVVTPLDPARKNSVAVTITTRDKKASMKLTAYEAAVNDATSRNRLISVLLKHSDDQCVRDSAMVVGNQSAANLILDLLTTGLTSAATIVTGEKADSILTGVGAFTSGSRSHVNADIYRGQFTEAITSAIAGEQQRLRTAIDQKRKSTTAEYTVDDAVRDVNEYYQACSFYKGLEVLLKSAQGYPRLVEEQSRERARQDLVELEQQLQRRRDEFLKLSGNAAAQGLLPGLQKQIDDDVALVAQRRSVAYPAPVKPDDAPASNPPGS